MSVSEDPPRLLESEVTALQAELESSLAVGHIPDGWTHQIGWHGDDSRGSPIVTALFIAGSAIGCGVAWGWIAGIAGAVLAGGIRMLLSIRGGPRPGKMITETFIPPDETLLKLGVAGHQIFEATRSRPQFSVERLATSADRRWVRRGLCALSSALVIIGGLTLLQESGAISAATYLRTSAIVGAAVSTALAAWIWFQLGTSSENRDTSADTSNKPRTIEVLDTVTTGSTTEAVGEAIWSLLPPKLVRVLLPTVVLVVGAFAVFVAFNVTPDPSQLWSGLAAATELAVFVLAGARAVILAVVSVLERKWILLRSALWTVCLMAGLLGIAKLFGWLDDWGTVIDWVRDRVV